MKEKSDKVKMKSQRDGCRDREKETDGERDGEREWMRDRERCRGREGDIYIYIERATFLH